MVDGYTLVSGTPSVEDYRRLRADSGLTPRTVEQSAPALAGTWWGCHVVYDATGEVVAMGRIIGDGGWYFHIADMATLPDHQRRGLGDLVLTALVDRIRAAGATARVRLADGRPAGPRPLCQARVRGEPRAVDRDVPGAVLTRQSWLNAASNDVVGGS